MREVSIAITAVVFAGLYLLRSYFDAIQHPYLGKMFISKHVTEMNILRAELDLVKAQKQVAENRITSLKEIHDGEKSVLDVLVKKLNSLDIKRRGHTYRLSLDLDARQLYMLQGSRDEQDLLAERIGRMVETEVRASRFVLVKDEF